MEEIFLLETSFILYLTQKYVNSRAGCITVQEIELVSKYSFQARFLTLSQSLPLSGWPGDLSELPQFQGCVTPIIMFMRTREKESPDWTDPKCGAQGHDLWNNLHLGPEQ